MFRLSGEALTDADALDKRRMVRASLLGSHSHCTLVGIRVHVWQRDEQFLARGRYQGRPFGETLGAHQLEAAARLRQILTDIEHGSYQRPSEARKQLVNNGAPQRLTLRQLVNEFLTEKRQLRGQRTAANYRARLAPVLAFGELPAHRSRWPLAADIDRAFVVALRAYLFQYQTTRNGRAGAAAKPLSARQVVNVVECLRTLLAWASNPGVQKLPPGWSSPITADLVDTLPGKDPFREDKLPLAVRVRLVLLMDRWQLCQLGLSLVLPLRPDEAVGLLVSDVNFERGWLEFGQRFTDSNFNKGKVAFRLPFPAELRPLLRVSIQGRRDGPLLRSRKAFARISEDVAELPSLQHQFDEALRRQQPDAVQTLQDRKRVFRAVLRQQGGVSADALSQEFKGLLAAGGVTNGATFYALRSAVTTAMKVAGLPHLEMRYLTSHSTNDILNEYTSLDPVGAMQKYFDTIRPLLAALAARAAQFGIAQEGSAVHR